MIYYRIDKDVPIPTFGKNRGIKETARSLEIGESFFVAGLSPTTASSVHTDRTRTYTTRTVTENDVTGVRIWRLA